MNDPKTFLEPLAGYLIDVWAKLRNDFFPPHSLTKLHNICRAGKRGGATTVIEVGAFKGVTTKRLSYFYDTVHSIEIDPDLCEHARKRCAGRRNVTIHLGDGKDVLAKLAPDVTRCVAFLDGHFSGGETGQGDEPEPVLAELDIIQKHIGNFVAVVIDDFHEFGQALDWPQKWEVMKRLSEVLPEAQWMHVVMYNQFISVRR